MVVAHIASLIVEAGGWISIADYMGAALYAPGLGYYVSGTRKFGEDGDFVTAPELTPLFGGALAAQVADVLVSAPGDVIELGPGTGRLAADVLAALAARDVVPTHYLLLEVSPDLRARQRELYPQQVNLRSTRPDPSKPLTPSPSRRSTRRLRASRRARCGT